MLITKSIRAAIEQVESDLMKDISIISLEYASELIGFDITQYHGVHWQNETQIIIGLNLKKPDTNENTFYHEILHAYLEKEEYAYITYNRENITGLNDDINDSQISKLAFYLGSSIQHPAVYKMMQNKFKVNMAEYFDTCVSQKIDRFYKKGSENSIFQQQQDIIDGFEYHYYDDYHKNKILEIFKDVSFDAYESCINIVMRINKKCSVFTSNGSKIAAQMLLARVKNYGEINKLGKLNRIWDAIIIN